MTADIFRGVRYSEAEVNARLVLSDGYGEALILAGTGGYYALYYLFGVLGLRSPQLSYPPDWVEGPRAQPEDFLKPYQMADWLDQNGYNTFVNESK